MIRQQRAPVKYTPPRPSTVYDEIIHGERTHIAVYSRIPDFSMHTIEMGAMELIAFRCGSVETRRYADELTGRSRPMSSFILQLSGTSSLRHYGNHITLEPGDLSLCNTNAGYELHHQHISEVIIFRVPTDRLKLALPTPEYHCGRKVAHSETLASTVKAMAVDLATRQDLSLTPELAERAGRHLLDMLAATFSAALDKRRACSAVMEDRFWTVKLHIEENLRNPELSPAFVARNLKLSDRYMRMIFAAGEEAPTAYILRRRLEECAREFRDPMWAKHSITDIAFSWGFNSAPHFARAFRAKFGESPRDYRQRHKLNETQH